jgi:hypothetical protein
MSLSNSYERKVLNALLGSTALVAPPTLYLALSTTALSDSVEVLTEPAGSYARVAVVNSVENFPATPVAVPSVKLNGAIFSFPESTEDWGVVTYFAFMSAPSGGELVLYGEITNSEGVPTPLAVPLGYIVRFNAGSLQFTLS